MLRMLSVAIAGLLLAASAATVAAASPTPVDPASLIPPPNPSFEWTCRSTGQRIDCRGVQVSGDTALPAFSCGAHTITIDFVQTVTAHRVHDATGRVLWAMLVGTFDELWTLDGASEPALTSKGRWTQRVDYAVPGVRESRTIVYTGATLAVSAPGQGVIFQNTGRTEMNWDESEVVAISGPARTTSTGPSQPPALRSAPDEMALGPQPALRTVGLPAWLGRRLRTFTASPRGWLLATRAALGHEPRTADDVGLVGRAASGDHDAFEALIAPRAARLIATARKILRDPDAADDAAQRTLVAAWRTLPRLRDHARFDAWLSKVSSTSATARRDDRVARRGVSGRSRWSLPSTTGARRARRGRSSRRASRP